MSLMSEWSGSSRTRFSRLLQFLAQLILLKSESRFLLGWPREIAPNEPIVRGICSPYHVSSSGKLKPEAYDPTPDTDEVSILRADWIWPRRTKQRAKRVADPSKKKVYRGLAVLTPHEITTAGAAIVDTREHYRGHADIKLGAEGR